MAAFCWEKLPPSILDWFPKVRETSPGFPEWQAHRRWLFVHEDDWRCIDVIVVSFYHCHLHFSYDCCFGILGISWWSSIFLLVLLFCQLFVSVVVFQWLLPTSAYVTLETSWLASPEALPDVVRGYTGVSKNTGTPKSSILIGVWNHYKPSILGAHPYFWKHPYVLMLSWKKTKWHETSVTSVGREELRSFPPAGEGVISGIWAT